MKNFIFFGLASAFNRGGMFLILPFLAYFLTISDYGSFSLYLIFIQLFIPILSLNFSSIIAREYYEQEEVVEYFLGRYNFLLFCLFLFLLVLSFFYSNKLIILFLIYLVVETIFIINSTYVRFKSGSFSYFLLCFLKIFFLSVGIFLIYFINSELLSSINNIFIIFILSSFSIFFYIKKIEMFFSLNEFIILIKKIRVNKAIFLFSIGLLPHTISQWVISSSDRFFLKFLTDDNALGYYSFSYSLAAIYMLVNSALALGMPQISVQNFKYFSSKKFSKLFFIFISILWLIFLGIFVFILALFDWKYNKNTVFEIGYLVLLGLYFLSYYYYYSSFLFYDRSVKKISFLTFFIAIFNVFLVLLLTPLVGVVGAAYATLISYLAYSYITFLQIKDVHDVRGLNLPILFALFITFILFLIKFHFNL